MHAAHKIDAAPIAILVTGDPVDGARTLYPSYADMFVATLDGRPTVRFDARAADELAALANTPIAGLLITGSSAHVHEREPWVLETEAYLRDAVARGTAILGVCFGHQLLGQALGGRVAENPRGLELSTVTIEADAHDPLLSVAGERFLANACHSDSVVELPDGATALATSPLDPHQCVRFSERCYGLQFHPEFDPRVMHATIDSRDALLRARGEDPAVYKARAQPTPAGPRLIRRFVERFVDG